MHLLFTLLLNALLRHVTRGAEQKKEKKEKEKEKGEREKKEGRGSKANNLNEK